MSNWTHTLTIVVPEGLMSQANQLALAVGTSDDDVNTFTSADWTDGTSHYAVCSTRAVDVIFTYFGAVDTTGNPDLADAMAATVFVGITTDTDGVTTLTNNDPTKIRVVTDIEPLSALVTLGLTRRATGGIL